jgi:hypothetical protein
MSLAVIYLQFNKYFFLIWNHKIHNFSYRIIFHLNYHTWKLVARMCNSHMAFEHGH